MTRRERRGTIVLLAAIALMLVVAFAARCHHEVVPEMVNDVEISRFETQVDSVQAEPLKPSHPFDTMKSTKTTKKRSRRASPKKAKPSREPRPVDPIPSF